MVEAMVTALQQQMQQLTTELQTVQTGRAQDAQIMANQAAELAGLQQAAAAAAAAASSGAVGKGKGGSAPMQPFFDVR